MTPCCVFEGSKHPMKINTHLDRLKRRQDTENSINAFYERGKNASIEVSAEERLGALKHVKTTSCPNVHVLSGVIDWMKNNDVACASAPCEAE